MNIKVKAGDISISKCKALILYYFEESGPVAGPLKTVDDALDGYISKLIALKDIKGKFRETTLIYSLGKIPPDIVLIYGLGKQEKFDADKIRVAVAEACKTLTQNSVETITSDVFGIGVNGLGIEDVGQSLIEGILLGTYSFKKYVSIKNELKEIKEFILMDSDENRIPALEKGVNKGKIYAEATNLARDMVNEPSNFMTPVIMAEKATQLAQKHDLNVKVLDRSEIQELGMGGILGVSQGSIQPPKFIVLNYKGKPSDDTDIALIGKGLTFDSGGISIKPSEGMGSMKGDMAGGASVIAAISAIAQLKPKINVIAIIPATENLPSGAALKPGDIITIMNGKTVEIITTDAEGRLILADGISYANKLKVKRMIDVATLTGACVVALGEICTGTFGNNQELINQVILAGSKAGECMWQMPMNDEYRDLNKTDIADVKNSGGRNGGAISAAWFLGEFADTTPWVHLDIAGTSLDSSDRGHKGYYVKGATGVPVRTLINLVLDLAK